MLKQVLTACTFLLFRWDGLEMSIVKCLHYLQSILALLQHSSAFPISDALYYLTRFVDFLSLTCPPFQPLQSLLTGNTLEKTDQVVQ